jgi:hypothetical protein
LARHRSHRLHLGRDFCARRGRRVADAPCTRAERHDLLLAGALEHEEAEERIAGRAPERKRPVVAQQHQRLLAEIGDDALPFVVSSAQFLRSHGRRARAARSARAA